MMQQDRCPVCGDYEFGRWVYDNGHGPGEVVECPDCGASILIESEEADGFSTWCNFVEAEEEA